MKQAVLGPLLLVAIACSGEASHAPPTPTQTPKPSLHARVVLTRTATPTPTPVPTVPPAPEVADPLEHPPVPVEPPPPPPPPPLPPQPDVNILHPPPYTVFIDPGHGGPNYTGAYSPSTGLVEKDVNLDIALRLAPLLTSAGYNVVLSRNCDCTLTQFDADTAINRRDEIQARVDVANQNQADILVSIHFNGSSATDLRGLEVYYNPDRSFGYYNFALADLSRQALLNSMRATGYDVVDRGVRNDALVGGDPNNPHSWVLGTNEGFRPSLMPGIIMEALFMSNDLDSAQLTLDTMRQAIAEGYKQGIDSYFAWLLPQVPASPTVTPTPTPSATPTPTQTPTPSPLPSPSATPSALPTATPTSSTSVAIRRRFSR